jgi:2-aminoadipate transaminase
MIDYEALLSRAGRAMEESAIRKMGMVAAQRQDLVSFAPGYPDPQLFAWAELREIAAEVLSGADGGALQYGPTRGYRPLIDAIAELLTGRGIAAAPADLVVTTGSQQGLDLVARVLLDPGDVALVELPSYTGALTAFRNVLARMAGVRQEADGIDLDDLDRVLRRERAAGRRVRFLYVVPNFQNPTGLLISREKRLRLLEWAARHDVLIIEDDPYGDIYFEDTTSASDTRPIKADDREGRVVYLSTFSKTLAPGFRVAWIAAPAPLTAKFETAKQAVDLSTGPLDQRIVYQAWKRGVVSRRLPILRSRYQTKRSVMAQTLREQCGDLVSWPEPRGGFFLWVSFPDTIGADRMLARATARGVIYVAGSAFYVENAAHNIARLSFSAPPPERIVDGVGRLAAALREELEDGRTVQRARVTG